MYILVGTAHGCGACMWGGTPWEGGKGGNEQQRWAACTWTWQAEGFFLFVERGRGGVCTCSHMQARVCPFHGTIGAVFKCVWLMPAAYVLWLPLSMFVAGTEQAV